MNLWLLLIIMTILMWIKFSAALFNATNVHTYGLETSSIVNASRPRDTYTVYVKHQKSSCGNKVLIMTKTKV